MVYSRMFGAGVLMDAFLVAFKIPNFMRRLFAEGAFSQAFVPVLAEYKNRRGEAETRLLVDRVATTLAGAIFLETLAGVGAAPLRSEERRVGKERRSRCAPHAYER